MGGCLEWMGGQEDDWMDGWMDVWLDGWVGGWTQNTKRDTKKKKKFCFLIHLREIATQLLPLMWTLCVSE